MRKNLQRLYKIQIALHDIHAARQSATEILERHDNFFSAETVNDPLFYPLLLCMTVSYARPFTNNKPQGPLKIEVSKGLRELHKKLIKKRKQVYAHTDGELFCVRYILQPEISGLMNNGSLTLEINPFIHSLQRADVENVPSLCDEITSNLNQQKEINMQKCSGVLSSNFLEIKPNGSIET